METSKGSALAIGFYPTFKYNASGGGGFGRVTGISGSRAFVEFDHKELYIPTLGWRTGEQAALSFALGSTCEDFTSPS